MANILNKNEILNLLNLIRRVQEFIDKIRKENPLAKKIKYPQIPPSLSESLTIHLIKEMKILPELHPLDGINLGGRTSDVYIKRNNENFKIEVKATTKSFQYLGQKDISCDILIWLNLENFYLNKDMISIYHVYQPNNYFNSPVKITLKKFLSVCDNNIIETTLDLKKYLNLI